MRSFLSKSRGAMQRRYGERLAYETKRVNMRRLSDMVSATVPRAVASSMKTAKARRGLAALCCALSASVLLPAQAQTSGALPIYRCVSADGTSSRISRTPCTAGESGTARNSVAGPPRQQPAVIHQTPAPSAQPSPTNSSADDAHGRPHAGHRSGRRR